MIFGDMLLGVETNFSPLGTLSATIISSCGCRRPPIHPQVQVQALIAGVEAEDVPPEEDDPDADFACAPLRGGGDDDEWETWCTDRAPGAAE